MHLQQLDSTSQKKEIMDVPILLGFGRNQFWQAVTDHQHTSGQEVSEPMLAIGNSNQGSSWFRQPSEELSHDRKKTFAATVGQQSPSSASIN